MSITKFSLPKSSLKVIYNEWKAELYITTPHLSVTDYIRLLESCIQSKTLMQGKTIHGHLLKNNTHIRNPLVLEKLVRFYVSCAEMELARHVFDTIRKPNVDLWNSMIRAYAWNGPLERALDLYYKMIQLGVEPTKFTFPFVLKACAGLRAIDDGEEIHGHAKRLGLDRDIYVCTSLIDLYAKCGVLTRAKEVFDGMFCRDIVAWNAMIAGFSLHGLYNSTIQLFIEMQKAGISPNSSTIVAVLPTVAEANVLNQGKAMHSYAVRRGFSNDMVVGTGLLDMYGKCQCIFYAKRISDMLEVKNEISWSVIIGAYVTCDLPREALGLFDRMLSENARNLTAVTLGTVLRACAKLTDLSEGKRIHCLSLKTGFVSDIMVGNTLLSMYAKCGIIDEAVRFFDGMDKKDTVSYSAIISGCSQNGYAQEALCIFHQMQLSGNEPDIATMVGVLPTCSQLAALQHGACGHGYSVVHGFVVDTSVCNALIDMYSKCGKIEIARKVFDGTDKRDIVSWNAMIVGYGIHGLGTEALLLFNKMQAVGLKPDDVTFICLLSACSHSGLVTEGKQLFNSMIQGFKIVPRIDHYICMVDLLGRAGILNEACKFIENMPFEPDVCVWGALLAACRVHKNIELGEEVSKKIQSLGSEGSGNFVLLSNMYSAVGRWHDAARVRITQREQGIKKSPGCSWVEINGVVHAFVGGDRSHPQSTQINEKLDELLPEMIRLGYHAESGVVLQDVEKEEKEGILLYHSEKLAIAFGILSLSPTKPILVTKNLRVCFDCHSAIKFITVITNREIIVRDASRFHHFRNGVCNCGDFW
ncbi:pentatricopeptide repeat-containing protein At3g16610 [Mangifera indica]|uniref:pentatricopeptide repeat-containing protein At3g16610 n=1 Tax=Mangifera indica TaxID=29780 RepID=UPI001CFB056C|nr:pentatricopeptide repeat-containing protein At3g16610 [Mangifera indica]